MAEERVCAFCGSWLVVAPAMGQKDAGLGLCDSCAREIEAQIPGLTLTRVEAPEELPLSERTTEFVMSSVQAPPDTPVLFVRTSEDMLSLARLDDVERLIQKVREEVYDEIQEFVVLTSFDTSVGRRIDEFITNRLIDLRGDAAGAVGSEDGLVMRDGAAQ